MDDSLSLGGATGNHAVAAQPIAKQSHRIEAQAAAAPQIAQESSAPRAPRTTSHTEFDPVTQSVVFRIVSDLSGTVITQIPTEIQLRVREHVAAVDATREAKTSDETQA